MGWRTQFLEGNGGVEMSEFHDGKLFCRALATGVMACARTDVHSSLSEVQMSALRFIKHHPDTPLYHLASGLKISSPAATKLVDRLAGRGWVKRNPHPSDRRKWVLILTDEGRRIYETVQSAEAKHFAEILQHMAPADRDALARGLEAFLEAVQHRVDREELCLQCGTDLQEACILHIW